MEFLNSSLATSVQKVVEVVSERVFWASVDMKLFESEIKSSKGFSIVQPSRKPRFEYRVNDGNLPSSPRKTRTKRLCRRDAPVTFPSTKEDVIIIKSDDVLDYNPLAFDFGPLDLPTTCRYLDFVDEVRRPNSVIIHISDSNRPDLCANSAYLVATYSHIRFNVSPQEIRERFETVPQNLLPSFRDASRFLSCDFHLDIGHFCEAIDASLRHQWIDWNNIRVDRIEKFQQVQHGDINWIIESKFLAFAGPSASRLDEDGFEVLTPAYYAKLFKKIGVTNVVRLNVANYDPSEFEIHGITHHDMFFEDGSCPPPDIIKSFLSLVKNAKGAIAVHCKAGLGRTATLIGLAVMLEYRVPAHVYIAWARIARPGSVIGPQQHFLVAMESQLHGRRKFTSSIPKSASDIGQGEYLVRQKRRLNALNSS